MHERPIHALLVEDEEAHVELLRRVLEEHTREIRLTVVGSLQEARAFLEKRQPDLVIADVVLPDGRGTELVEGGLEARPYPVVVITAYGNEQMAVDTLKAGALDYVAKSPEALADMSRTVERALRQWGHITERKRAEEALRASEERFRALIESSSDAISVLAADGTVLYESPSLLRVLGLRPQERLGKIAFRFTHPDDVDASRGRFQDALCKPGVTTPFETRLVHGDGSWRTVEGTITNLLQNAAVGGIVVNMRDITERKRAEEALAAERNLLRTVIDNLPDPVVVKDAEGRYVLANPAQARPLGLEDPQDVVGKTPFDLYPEEPARGYYDADQRVLTSGEPLIDSEDMVIDSLGQERWFLVSKVPLRDAGGSVVGLVSVGREITERKRAEEALREYSERLEEMVEERTRELRVAQEELLRSEKLALLGEVAGAMGHELRNPLGAIKNAVYYLNMVLEETDPEVRDTLDILNLEVGNCAKIVQDLLDFARSRPPVHVQIQVNDTVQGALSDIPVPEGVEVVTELDEGLPPIAADAIQLNQVFGNIITNAFQAMPEGGRLLIRSRAAEGEGVAISFADTGVGILEENLGRMFEPLFTTKAKGIGLGLAAVRLLVERHGGKVEVESEPGRGSTFTVWLPVRAGSDLPAPGADA